MDNNNRLEIILKLREIRNKLNNLSFSKEEKEVIKQSLNLYEEELDISIARVNNINNQLDDNIISNNQILNVPIEEKTSKYIEYANIYKFDVNNVISNLLNKIDINTELLESDKQIILKALKNYFLSIQQLENIKSNNKSKNI